MRQQQYTHATVVTDVASQVDDLAGGGGDSAGHQRATSVQALGGVFEQLLALFYGHGAVLTQGARNAHTLAAFVGVVVQVTTKAFEIDVAIFFEWGGYNSKYAAKLIHVLSCPSQ
ncbi:hypothetical protein D3C80_1452190 [compost metagenome]